MAPPGPIFGEDTLINSNRCNRSGNNERDAILTRTRARMHRVFSANQILGRRQTIGCTAVEITQRCNLDCTLCYLSEHSEAIHDVPIEEVFRRLDEIRREFGPGVHVQITGGDPTLRKHLELVAIVRHARRIGLFPALFTNGIAATRRLLKQLATAGLVDVAFHVDTTQRRRGFSSEKQLHVVREQYIERARGLGLMVIFNTTVHAGNFHELPELAAFFAVNAGVVGLASFQLQADTGRGEWGERDRLISIASVRRQIENAAGRPLGWDMFRIGHPECHSYAPALAINGRVHPLELGEQWANDYLEDFAQVTTDRHAGLLRLITGYGSATFLRPRWFARWLRLLFSHAWRARRDLVAARGRVHKLSFFVHNFMDAMALDKGRIDACSFMLMTADGPVSMCAHNARRDDYILKPITVTRRDGSRIVFDPLRSGKRRRVTARTPARTRTIQQRVSP